MPFRKNHVNQEATMRMDSSPALDPSMAPIFPHQSCSRANHPPTPQAVPPAWNDLPHILTLDSLPIPQDSSQCSGGLHCPLLWTQNSLCHPLIPPPSIPAALLDLLNQVKFIPFICQLGN